MTLSPPPSRPPAAAVRTAFCAALRAALWAALLLPHPAGAVAGCEEGSPLSLLAFDSGSGKALFSLLNESGEMGLLELDPQAGFAPLYPAGEPAHFAGSVGPGPIFALRPCGDGCVAAETWREGAWTPLGETLRAPAAANLYATWDRLGRPWVVAHQASTRRDWVHATAFRLDGQRWREEGRLAVHSVPSLGAGPAPQRPHGVVSGSGLFATGEEPRTWLAGRPALPEGRRGQALAVDSQAAVYLDDEGELYFSPDQGRSWRRSPWTPWGEALPRAESARSGVSLDLPLGALGPPLPVAWFDRRPGGEARLYLAELEGDGSWWPRVGLSPELREAGGESHELFHLLRTGGGLWLLATDCLTGDGSGPPHILLQTASLAGLRPLQTLPVVPRRPVVELE